MRRSILIISLLAFHGAMDAASRSYPPAARSPEAENYHGVWVEDPYRWLEKKEAPEVTRWVQAQNELARTYLDALPERTALIDRLTRLSHSDKVTLPKPAGERLFYLRTKSGSEKPILYWQGPDGKEYVALDPNRMAIPVSSRDWLPSPDGRYLIYFSNPNNADEAVLRVRDVDNAKDLANDVIPGATFADPSWLTDSSGFYYMRLPVSEKMSMHERVARADVRFHRLGSDPQKDKEVYPPTGNPQKYLTPRVSRDGRWLIIKVWNGFTSNDLFIRPRSEEGVFKALFKSTTSVADTVAWNGKFFLHTSERAPRYRVLSSAYSTPASWQTIVAEDSVQVIQDMQIVGDHVVLRRSSAAVATVEWRLASGKPVGSFRAPVLGNVTAVSGQENRPDLFIQFESYAMPTQIFRTTVTGGSVMLWGSTRMAFDGSAYVVEQRACASKDGTRITFFYVHRRDQPPGPQPILLHGYGGFAESASPRFNPAIVPWLEAGGAYVEPNVRGGGEYGDPWHRQGMGTQKQNTFDDFIAVAEYLQKENMTTANQLAIDGVSNGGLLVGAVVTQRPELFRAAVCKVPLLDMIRYPLYGEAGAWVSEYGTPDHSEEFRALYAYSPYHHVTGQKYPAMLLVSNENDDRVDPMHARKMAAALQASQQGDAPILLLTQSNAGHAGAGKTSAWVSESTDRLAFLMNAVGLKPK